MGSPLFRHKWHSLGIETNLQGQANQVIFHFTLLINSTLCPNFARKLVVPPTYTPEECDPVKKYLSRVGHKDRTSLYRLDFQKTPTTLSVIVPLLMVHFTLDSRKSCAVTRRENKSIIRSRSRIAPVLGTWAHTTRWHRRYTFCLQLNCPVKHHHLISHLAAAVGRASRIIRQGTCLPLFLRKWPQNRRRWHLI